VPKPAPRAAFLKPTAALTATLPLDGPGGHALEYFRVRTAPAFTGCLASDIWDSLVLQLGQRHPSILFASTAIGSLYHYRELLHEGPSSATVAKTSHDLAVTNYSKAVSGLRSYLEAHQSSADAETTYVVLTACLLFICFEMMEGNQALVMSHLAKGLGILRSRYIAPTRLASAKGPVILGTDFPGTMDNLAEVFVRLDIDATLFGRRTTYLSTTCQCCCRGTEIGMPDAFQSVRDAKAHLDLLTNATFTLRGKLLDMAEEHLAMREDVHAGGLPQELTDRAKYQCKMYAVTKKIDLYANPERRNMLDQQRQILGAFEKWSKGVENIQDANNTVLTMLKIQHFFPFFILSTLQDDSETACDRFHDHFRRILDLGQKHAKQTTKVGISCNFSLESGVLASLYIIALKCRQTSIRREAIELLRSFPTQEGIWSGRIFACYLSKVVEMEESLARELRPHNLPGMDLTYASVPEQARFGNVLLATDEKDAAIGRVVCARSEPGPNGRIKIVDGHFSLRTEHQPVAADMVIDRTAVQSCDTSSGSLGMDR